MTDPGTMRPCVFFDRDGIVNESPGPGYVQRWEDFHLQPGFVAALRTALAKGYAAVVVTNQQGVAKGLLTEAELQDIHARLRAQLRARGLDLLDVLHCPHFAADGCACRKPKPGLLLRAAQAHRLDLAASWMVGDAETDVEAGRGAGCRTVRVCPAGEATRADFRTEHTDGVAAILDRELVRCA